MKSSLKLKFNHSRQVPQPRHKILRKDLIHAIEIRSIVDSAGSHLVPALAVGIHSRVLQKLGQKSLQSIFLLFCSSSLLVVLDVVFGENCLPVVFARRCRAVALAVYFQHGHSHRQIFEYTGFNSRSKDYVSPHSSTTIQAYAKNDTNTHPEFRSPSCSPAGEESPLSG